MTQSIDIYATRQDLGDVLEALESVQPLRYFRIGAMQTSLLAATFESVSALADLGQATPENLAGYLISASTELIHLRHITGTCGNNRYVVDQLANPHTIVLKPGGWSQSCLVSGQLGTASRDPRSVALYRLVSARVRRVFARLGSYYVGAEALRELRAGKRLCIGENASRVFDLKEA